MAYVHHSIHGSFAVVVTLIGAACNAKVGMCHPLDCGVTENHQIDWAESIAKKYGLPGETLKNECTLTTLTSEQICFRLVLRTLAGRPDLATPGGWTIILSSKTDFEDDAPRFEAVKEFRTHEVTGYEKRVAYQYVRWCNGFQYCETQRVEQPYYEPFTATIVTGGGVVCFANNGHVTAETRELELELEDPQTAGWEQRDHTFRYAFE